MTTSLGRLVFNRHTLLAFAAGVALCGGVVALAQSAGAGMHAFHHGAMMSGNPADMAAHLDQVVKHLYVEINATDAQKAQIDPLVKQAVDDLAPLHSQAESAHAQFVRAFTQDPIDRNSLEAARETHMQLADQASRRIAQLVGDVGSALTPAQRQKVADHLQQMHGMHGGTTPVN
jgi:Spy/CpxP family protein refolding chaperone